MTTTKKSLHERVKTRLTWPWRYSLPRARPMLIALSLPVLVFVIVSGFQPDDRWRWISLILQGSGLGTAAWGIRDTRLAFGKPALMSRVRAWFRETWRKPAVVSVKAGSAIAFGGELDAYRLHNPKDDSVEARVAALEANLTELRQDLSAFKTSARTRHRDLERTIAQEKASRLEATKQLENLIESTQTKGLDRATIGVFWTLLGVAAGAPV